MTPEKSPRVLGPGGRFAVLRQLGGGEFAEVFLTTDRQTRARVALKLLRASARRRGGVERLRREFEALSGVEHANLARLHELFIEGPECFFTMEYVEGVDFVSWVRSDLSTRATRDARRDPRSGPLPARRAEFVRCTADGLVRLRRCLPQLVGAVGRVHEAGLVHGDIKPDNVLVAYGGRVVLLDYGLVARASAEEVLGASPSARASGPAGTPAYIAPESCEREQRMPASDWYSVGLLLFESLTGTLPFTGGAAEVVVRKRTLAAPKPSAFTRDVPTDLDDLCARLLETNPSKRPTGAELVGMAAAASATP